MANRAKKSINNMAFGVIEQIITILLTFITRTIFIKVLNSNLLGINGLFSNVLSILSIAELGFGTAIIYGMYKPIKENDKYKIAALMNYYKKIYNTLAIVVAILGVILIPFLKYLVNTDAEIDNLVFYYIIFLVDSVLSYLLANRVAIIEANQNTYIIKRYNTVFIVLKNILQIVTLLMFKNFIIYLLIQIITTFLSNLYGAIISRKMYPYAFDKTAVLEKEEKKKLLDNVKSMAIYRLGGAIMNHTDNILISVMCGTICVGFYSNYTMIISSITRFTNIIFTSLTASIGNLNAGNDKNKKLNMFYNLEFFSNWLFGFGSIAIYILINPFISLWIGSEYMLDNYTVIAIALNFYILGVLKPNLVYRDTTGLFKETKYIFVITATINLVLSIILGKIYGIFGILIASSIARILTNFWFEPHTLFKKYFNKSSRKYFMGRLFNIFLVFINSIIIMFLDIVIKKYIFNQLAIFIMLFAITVIIPNIIFFICYKKTDEFKYFKELLGSITKKLFGKFIKRARR